MQSINFSSSTECIIAQNAQPLRMTVTEVMLENCDFFSVWGVIDIVRVQSFVECARDLANLCQCMNP